MVTTYGSFPGVKVSVAGGGITSVAVGGEEILVLFGEANYQTDDPVFDTKSDGDVDGLEPGLDGSVETPESINARRQADALFGEGSELADGMRKALSNGANVNFLHGVAPQRVNVIDEIKTTQSGTLDNAPIWEEDVLDESNIEAIVVEDNETTDELTVEYTYSSPSAPSDSDTIRINPLTGEFAADAPPDGTTTEYSFDYKYLDWTAAFEASAVNNVMNEDDTATFVALSQSDDVSSDLSGTVSDLRTQEYKLVTAISGALPNANEEVLDSNGDYLRRDARYDTANFTSGSVDKDYYFKLAPVRLEDSTNTILGGVGGLFAGNPINDPIYNEALSGYDTLEQTLTKSEANDLRQGPGASSGPDVRVIPVRQSGSIRVKDNLSTSTATDWERDFWRRRIADRVILIAKQIGDSIIGRINDEQTRNAAERFIESELRALVADRLLRPNEDGEQQWFVDVYEDSTNSNQVNIDVGFTPYGIVKRVDETITINT